MMTFIAIIIKLWLTGNYWVDIMDAKPQKWIYLISEVLKHLSL